jgi:hypothetical protein
MKFIFVLFLSILAQAKEKPFTITVPELEMMVACYQCCLGETETMNKTWCTTLGATNWNKRKNCGCDKDPKPAPKEKK